MKAREYWSSHMVTLNSTTYWDVIVCSLVGGYLYFRRLYCSYLHDQHISQARSDAKDEGRMLLRNGSWRLNGTGLNSVKSQKILCNKRRACCSLSADFPVSCDKQTLLSTASRLFFFFVSLKITSWYEVTCLKVYVSMIYSEGSSDACQSFVRFPTLLVSRVKSINNLFYS
jgi:hypothetical protein